jgi:phage gp29-like protein
MANLLDQFGRPIRQKPDTRDSLVAAQRVALETIRSFNPVKDLTPQKLVRYHDQFDAGFVGPLGRLICKIKELDDVVPNVAAKREGGPGTRGYQIVARDETPKAQAHQETLEYFYDNLTVRSAIDMDEVGGAELLFRQQMHAVSSKYVNHEIIWRPSTKGITAELRCVPLWFFERTTGKLRFLQDSNAQYGVDLDPGRWLVTVSPVWLGKAISICRLYKQTPLKDWLIYCGRHGMPGIAGKTNATKDGPEWNAMENAVKDFAAEFAAVMSNTDSIEVINLSAQGQLPYPGIVERMDRMMAALYRGADLSTLSSNKGEGTGASLQGEEADILEAQDASMIEGALHRQLDRLAIFYRHGDTMPLAGININGSVKDTVAQDLKVDKQLHEMRFPISVQSLARRYDRTIPDPDEDLIPPPSEAPATVPAPLPAENALSLAAGLAERRLLQLAVNGEDRVAAAIALDLAPIAERFEAALQAENEAEGIAILQELQADMPRLMRALADGSQAARVVEDSLAAALMNGWASAAAERGAS